MKNKLKSGKEVAPCIFIYENIIKNSEEIIKFAKSSKDLYEGKATIGNPYSPSINTEIRNVDQYNISPIYANDAKCFKLAQKIWQYGDLYAKQHDMFFSLMENPQFCSYKPNDGFYKSHVDSGPGSPRLFSAVLYLNDVEKGGETYFTKFDISVTPKEGRLLLFPANYAYEHQAKTPISNEKNIVVTWFVP